MNSRDSPHLSGDDLLDGSIEALARSLGLITDLPSWFLKNCAKTSEELAVSDPALHVEKAKTICSDQRSSIFQDGDGKYEIDVDFYAFARDEVAASASHKALFFRTPARQDNPEGSRGFLAGLVHSLARDLEADLVTLDMADMANLAEHYARREKKQDWAQKDGIWPEVLLEQYDADFYDEFEFDVDPLDSIPIPFKEIITAAFYKSSTRHTSSPHRVILHIPNTLSFTKGLLGRNILRYIARSVRRQIHDSAVTIILSGQESPPTLSEPHGSDEPSPEEVVGLTELGDISDVIYVVPNESEALKSLMEADSRSQQLRYYVDQLQKMTRRLRTVQREYGEEQEESSMLLPYSRLGTVLSSELGDSMTGEPSFYLAQCLAEVENLSDHRAIRNAAREARQIEDVVGFQYLEDSDNMEEEEQEMRQDSEHHAAKNIAMKKANNWDKWEKQVADLIVDVANLKDSWKDIDIDAESRRSIVKMVNLCHSSSSDSSGILRNASAKGAVLYGPPGTGKTHLARVLAKESRSVMIHVSAADILQKYVGEAEKFVKALFSVGCKVAPSIIFIDEADAFLRTRTAEDKPWTRSMISQFLQDSDGLQRMKNPPFLLLATNNPQDLDAAVLRRIPGRLYIGMPSAESRERIFQIFLRDESLSPVLDFKKLARMTDGYTGSDIHALCVNAASICEDQVLMLSADNAKAVKRVLMLSHFVAAIRRTGPTVHATTLSKFRRFAHEFHPDAESRIMVEEGEGDADAQVLKAELVDWLVTMINVGRRALRALRATLKAYGVG
ncbi:hypothetical protein F5Y12DRAFT_799401 [Xylaria sp. FL1777]|nr:hypothetical protein F5Y12DRAFT_799401 [Xylaria sp. FL1777]